MYLAIIVLPLLGSIISGFFGRKIGVRGAQIITLSCVLITTFFSLVAFKEVGINNISVSIELFRWIDSESLNVTWAFYFDALTVSMLIPVLIVSSLVHIYSIGYMSHDPHNQRFFSYLSLFTFMMIILVTANNLLLMFFGWEGVGICSYLLVNFWYTRIAANQSSISAFLTNRVGDCFLTIGMFAVLWSFGNLDYSTVFSLAPYISDTIITVIGICLLIGAMAKSSQVGLHVWLPMAMEGPTPVSALIHAATMVTAGVYLLIRTSPLIEYSSTVLMFCLWIGAITTVFSSLIGLFQQDIKKVIAYSTMSQLGMMVIAVGLSSYNIALYHLVNHAFYKGLLFLGAGAVIHGVADDQDFRNYGGLVKILPLTYTVMLIASLSLVAFPFMTGFYSKDFILESSYGQYYFTSSVIYYIAVIGAIFTTLYSVKVLYLTFLTNYNGPLSYIKKLRLVYLLKSDPYLFRVLSVKDKLNYFFSVSFYLSLHKKVFAQTAETQDGNIFMTLPLIILAILSIFFGYLTKDIFIGFGSSFFADNSLFVHPSHEILLDTEFAVPSLFKLLPLIFTVFFCAVSLLVSGLLPRLLVYFKFSNFGYNMFSFFNQRFLIELLYNKYIVSVVLMLGGQTSKVIDKGSIEFIGPFGLEKGLLNLSKNIARLDTGVITSYALYILVGLMFYIIVPYLSLADNNLLLFILFALFTIVNNVIKNTPSKPYPFITLSLKNGIGLNLFKTAFLKTFSLKNIISIVFVALIVYFVRTCLQAWGLDLFSLKSFLFVVFSGKFTWQLFNEIFDLWFTPQYLGLSQPRSDLGNDKKAISLNDSFIHKMDGYTGNGSIGGSNNNSNAGANNHSNSSQTNDSFPSSSPSVSSPSPSSSSSSQPPQRTNARGEPIGRAGGIQSGITRAYRATGFTNIPTASDRAPSDAAVNRSRPNVSSQSENMYSSMFSFLHPNLYMFHPSINRNPVQYLWWRNNRGEWCQVYENCYHNAPLDVYVELTGPNERPMVFTKHDTLPPSPVPDTSQFFVIRNGYYIAYNPKSLDHINKDIFVQYNHQYMKTGYKSPNIALQLED